MKLNELTLAESLNLLKKNKISLAEIYRDDQQDG